MLSAVDVLNTILEGDPDQNNCEESLEASVIDSDEGMNMYTKLLQDI